LEKRKRKGKEERIATSVQGRPVAIKNERGEKKKGGKKRKKKEYIINEHPKIGVGRGGKKGKIRNN